MSDEMIMGSDDVAIVLTLSVHDPESIFDPEEVKGPDPKVWGADSKRPSASAVETATVDDKGKPMEVKGPDPKVWGKQEES